MQEFLRPLAYMPPPHNPVKLSSGLEKYKLIFCCIALKGSTDKKILEKGSMGGKRLRTTDIG